MEELVIKESDIGLDGIDREAQGSTLDKPKRNAVRSIVLNNKNEVALLYVKKYGYHKLPGGGIEEDEDKEVALRREIREEVGVEAKIDREIGKVVEYRDQYGQTQTSTAYISRVSNGGGNSPPAFTQLEQSQDFSLMWVPLEAAAKIIRKDTPLNYEGRFIQKRDSEIIQWAKKALESNTVVSQDSP